MNYYTPNSTSELLVVRVDHDLICANLIRLEQVVLAIDLLSVDSDVEIGVRLIIERPRVYLDDTRLLQAEEEVAVIAAAAPEIDRLIVLKLDWLRNLDQVRHVLRELGTVEYPAALGHGSLYSLGFRRRLGRFRSDSCLLLDSSNLLF